MMMRKLPWLPMPLVRECSRRRLAKVRMYLYPVPCLMKYEMPWLPMLTVRECPWRRHPKMRMYLS